MHITDKIVSSEIKKRMINGMFWSFSGNALAKLLTLIAGILCAHILKKEAYGEFCMIRSTINMFVVLGAGGLGVTATKYISEFRKEHKEKIPHIYLTTNSFAIFTGIICTILIILLSNSLATGYLKEPSLSIPLQIGGVLLFFSIINGVQNGTIIGFEDFRSIAINTLFGSIFETIFMLAGAYFYGIKGAILGFGLGFIAIYLCNKLTIIKLFRNDNIKFLPMKYLNKSSLNIIFKYSLPAAFSSLLITPTFWFIRSLLVRKSSFDELAIFEAADQWKVIILFIPTAISQIVLPILSSMQKDNKTFKNTLLLNIIVITSISIIIALIVVFFSNIIMSLYGKNFNDSMPLKILAISTIFSAVANVLEMSIYSIGKMWQCFVINLTWAATTIGLTYFFLNKGTGASGLSYAILISYLLSCAIFGCYTWRLSKKHIIAV